MAEFKITEGIPAPARRNFVKGRWRFATQMAVNASFGTNDRRDLDRVRAAHVKTGIKFTLDVDPEKEFQFRIWRIA